MIGSRVLPAEGILSMFIVHLEVCGNSSDGEIRRRDHVIDSGQTAHLHHGS